MKYVSSRKQGVLIISACVFCALMCAFVYITQFSATMNLHNEGELSHNLSQRELWEWMRYHDPATGKIPHNVRASELALLLNYQNVAA